MTATDKLEKFFAQKLIPKIPEVIYFKLSDGEELDRLIADSVSSDIYPGIFLIRPQNRRSGQDTSNIYASYDVKLYVFCKTEISELDDQEERENTDLSAAESIATKLAIILGNYNTEDDYELTYCPIDYDDNDWVAVPVRGEMSMDAPLGYEITFKLGLPAFDIS